MKAYVIHRSFYTGDAPIVKVLSEKEFNEYEMYNEYDYTIFENEEEYNNYDNLYFVSDRDYKKFKDIINGEYENILDNTLRIGDNVILKSNRGDAFNGFAIIWVITKIRKNNIWLKRFINKSETSKTLKRFSVNPNYNYIKEYKKVIKKVKMQDIELYNSFKESILNTATTGIIKIL